MKKGVSILAALCLIFALTACGSGEPSANGHVADDYHMLLESKDSTYYYEANVLEQFMDGEEADQEPMKSVMAEGRKGKDLFVIIEGEKQLEQRQIETGDKYYTVFDPDKEYTAEPNEEEEVMDLEYVETSEMELDGKTWRYDEYQDEYEMETFAEEGDQGDSETYLYIKRYLVDDRGELYALVYLNELKGEDGQENQLIYQRIDTITEFQDGSAPEDVFQIPDDYKEINYDDEDLLEEE